jgi:hypothetical protein
MHPGLDLRPRPRALAVCTSAMPRQLVPPLEVPTGGQPLERGLCPEIASACTVQLSAVVCSFPVKLSGAGNLARNLAKGGRSCSSEVERIGGSRNRLACAARWIGMNADPERPGGHRKASSTKDGHLPPV